VIRERYFRHIVGKLVGVPTRLIVVAVHVDRAEDAKSDRQPKLVLEGMAGKDGMALLDIDLDLVFEPKILEKAVDGGDVVIILMLGRFLRLRLDQDRPVETDL